MSFAFTEEQAMLREMAARFVEEVGGSQAVRAAAASEPGHDPAVWRQMVELGWSGIIVPESAGGLGLGQIELSILAAACGRALLPSPLIATMLAARALSIAGDEEQCARWLPPIARGEITATVALTHPEGRHLPGDVGVRLRREGQDCVLDGAAGFVLDGHVADLLLVAARDGEAIRFVAIPAATEGLAATRQNSIDIGRAVARIDLTAVRAGPEAVLPGDAFEALLLHANATLAAEQMGAAAAALDRTVDYAGQRIQFGQPIGAFQAVKHALADLALLVEAAESAVWYAAAVADQRPEELPIAAATAKLMASDALSRCAADMIHYHGGIGFTWEHDAHLYFRRARAAAGLFGDTDRQLAIIADGMTTDREMLRAA
ncbi:MAG: acyl-CoA dehydrogenase family protein [Sphingomonas sp.]|nr:acyl-CoA dehydrogenase family protein [Sphingomonas sp.]MDX3886336.1 acyl-CoA dehydrogenase family protein [Sphingomonas sp.]